VIKNLTLKELSANQIDLRNNVPCCCPCLSLTFPPCPSLSFSASSVREEMEMDLLDEMNKIKSLLRESLVTAQRGEVREEVTKEKKGFHFILR
jgi:hypothetical protein